MNNAISKILGIAKEKAADCLGIYISTTDIYI
ncbi:hypothetical protein Dip510_001269 [Elusimicrobium posterum]